MPAKLRYFDGRVASVEEVVAAIREDGACVVTNLIEEEVCDGILSEMKPYMDRCSKGREWVLFAVATFSIFLFLTLSPATATFRA